MNALPMRYLGWMTRDLAFGPGLFMLAAGMSVILVTFVIPGVTVSEISINGVAVNQTAINGATLIWAARLCTVFTVLVTAGIVSRDFAGGYHRTLFSRPVSPALYYLLRWLLGGIAVLLGVLLVDAGVAVRLHTPMSGISLLQRTGLLYVLTGSLVFALSTVTRRDWVIAVVLMFAHNIIGSARDSGLWTNRWASLSYNVLPPFQLVGPDGVTTWGVKLAHVTLYGIGLLLAAMAVLRWRPLGSAVRD